MDRLEAMRLTRDLAHKFMDTVPFPKPKGWVKALFAVEEMIAEAETADADPKKRVALANEVLVENKLATVETILVLSTSHVSGITAQKLTEDTIPLVSVRPFGDDGWIVYVPTDPSIWDALEADVEKGDMPTELFEVLKFANELKCVWVLLDSAALEVSGLQSFDW